MPDDQCLLNPQQDCFGLKRAEEVAGDVRAIDRRMSEFQQSVTDTHSRFGSRIGKLEAHNDVQDERLKQIRDAQTELKQEIAAAQKDQRDAIAELRNEHRESMKELKDSNQEILDAVTPMKHKVEDLEQLAAEVDNLKAKPGETWEHIKKQGLGWVVALILAILTFALGLDKYL